MGFQSFATRAMARTIEKTLPVASTEKLMSHHVRVRDALTTTDDVKSRTILYELIAKIELELERRHEASL
jgi:hypothetical protein